MGSNDTANPSFPQKEGVLRKEFYGRAHDADILIYLCCATGAKVRFE
jgi:hypothetical protein